MDKWFSIMEKLRVILAIVAITTLVSACSDNNTNNKGNVSSEQKHNVIKQDGNIKFTLGDREFVIPEGNFKGGTETGGSELIRATIWGLLPEFEGYNKEKNHAEFIGKRGVGRVVRIEIYRRSGRVPVSEMVSGRLGLESNSAISGRLGEYDELRHGLEYYRSDDYGDDIYLYLDDGQPVVFIRCPASKLLENMPYPACRHYWNISKGTSAEMRYSMDYLPQWYEIWQRAQRLLGEKQ